MSNKPLRDSRSVKPLMKEIPMRLRRTVLHNWGIKLACIGISLVIWGALISQDASLTREKTFKEVAIGTANADALQRSGLIVVDGLEDLAPIQMRAAVPQRNYDTVMPANYNVRVDLSRITAPGEQMLPVLTTSTSPYGQVTWLSKTEVQVQVDEYVTRRRIPVQLEATSQTPAGFFAAAPSVDPTMVVISGPRQSVEKVARCVAVYDVSRLAAQAGTQMTAVPFVLQDMQGNVIDSHQISVTSESILLDSVMVEQVLYPMKTVDIQASAITQGQPAPGYEVRRILVTPAYLSVAGTAEFLKSLNSLEVESTIDLTDATETMVRAVKVTRPANAQFMSEDAVYVTVEIARSQTESTATP